MRKFRRILCLALAAISLFGSIGFGVSAAMDATAHTRSSISGENRWPDREALLYPDIGSQNYPVLPHYLQQDYPDDPYGPDRTVSSHGCGITAMAMVATYLTDREYSPPALALMFSDYSAPAGTEQALFDDAPEELGFYCEGRTFSWSKARSALENGQIVVSLQSEGLFTMGGHFIILTDLTEDGKVMVVDPNKYNYGTGPRMVEGFTNGFSADDIIYTNNTYWIYEKKTVCIATCTRCGNDYGAVVAMALFEEDYFCDKCKTVLQKKEIFDEAVHIDHDALLADE